MKRYILLFIMSITATIFSITASSAQTVAAVTLSNGPPNIPNASPGSCTTTTCAWIQAGFANEAVSDVYADLSPMSANYNGSFSLTGPNASSFSISTSSDGTRNVGHITTNGSLSAGDYSINACAGATCQTATVHAVSGIAVACGTDGTIQNAVNSAAEGTTFLLSGCTYNFGNPVVPKNNDIFVGQGCTGETCATTLDGGNQNIGSGAGGCATYVAWCAAALQGNVTGVTIMNMGIQHFGPNNGGCWNCLPGGGTVTPNSVISAIDGWNLRGSVIKNNTATGYSTLGGGPSLVANNIFNTNGYDAFDWNVGACPGCSPNGGTGIFTVVGNEVANSNYGLNNVCYDVGGKIDPSSTVATFNFTNNYFHDNHADSVWTDYINNRAINVFGNTFLRGGTAGLEIEVTNTSGSGLWDIHHNVFSHMGDGSTTYGNDPGCGGATAPRPAILSHSSQHVHIHDNNFNVFSGSYGDGRVVNFDPEDWRGDSAGQSDQTFNTNTVNFNTTSNGSVLEFGPPTSQNTSGSGSSGNHYHLIGGNTSNDQHWQWYSQSGASNLGGYQATGNDTAGSSATIDTTGNVAAGCTHVACSGAGVGPGGVPVAAAISLSIQSVKLSNSTFTPNVANGVLGTVSVTISDGSAFSGKLSITGTNSGGFQLSGNTLEEKVSGTPAGSYNDFNIVATQSTASNSPQQISPTVMGVVDAPFGGTARSITNRIEAEDFDVGGYGVAFRATDACTLGIDTAYGPDRLNVYPTADLDSENSLKIGCNQAGDWHNYTITVPATGTYTLNVRVANIQAGAAYHVAVDGASVVSGIAVPNTGDYDTFATVTSKPFGLTAGQHILQLVLDAVGPSGFGGDFNWMQGTLVKAGAIGSKNIDITVTH